MIFEILDIFYDWEDLTRRYARQRNKTKSSRFNGVDEQVSVKCNCHEF